MPDVHEIAVSPEIPAEDISRAISLALMAVEALHGVPSLQLSVPPKFDEEMRTVEVDISEPVGRDIARLVIGLVSQQHGGWAVHVEPRGTRRW